ncbi:hypothetical protein F480_02905 [Bibersteinia trehalosi Y31]|uniref:Autotransporter adhesin n=1 Tax=Bibersteinia trehalosi Y31 TaxID=1261658 RepID=A0A179D1Y1_BIBTR|nr:YadA-like family protein [Bibersteinia trehalosi]OAQ15818.1 hypothetical protein F480_02905 [Bibersteinia trehalosi Y31]
MNKIFKVIWSHATRTFVVASELAKNNGKVASSVNQGADVSNNYAKTFSLSLLSASVMLGIPSNVEAAVAISSTTKEGTIVVNTNQSDISGGTGSGVSSQTTRPYNYYNPGSKSYENASTNNTDVSLYNSNNSTGIALGLNADARGQRNNFSNGIAIGDYSNASGGLAVSIGAYSQALDIGSVALGTSSRAAGFNSFAAMRQSAAIGDYSVAIGSTAWADSRSSLAIGSSATAKGTQSFAIGSADHVTLEGTDTTEARRTKYDGMNNTQTNGNRSFAIGTSAKTNGDDSFAFGSDANTGAFDVVNDTYLNANVAQANTSAKANRSFALGTGSRALKDDAFALGTSANSSGESSFSLGTNATATDKNAFALGTASNATGENSVAFGVQSNATKKSAIAFGVQSNATAEKAIAFGTEAFSNGSAAVAVGSSSKASGERSIAIGADANVTQKSGGSIAIGENATVDAKESTAVGMKSKALSNFSTSIGASSQVAANAESGMAIGHSANVTAANATAIGTNATASHTNAVALGSASTTRAATNESTATVNGITYSDFAGNNPSSVVSVGSSGAERQIVNVAAGNVSANSTDAINGSQLYLVAVEAAKKSIVKAGTNTNVSSTAHTNGSITYTVDTLKTIAEKGSDYVTVTESSEANNVFKYTIDLNQTTKDAINQVSNNTQNITNLNNTIKQGWNITTTASAGGKVDNSSTANVQLGDLVTIDAGQNINITQSDRKISIATSMDPAFNSVTTNNFTVNASGVVNMGGNTVQNVANGTNATDAVNLQQLNASKSVVKAGNYTNVTSSSDANGTVYTVNADKSVVKAGTNVNVTTDTDGKGLTNYTVKVDGDLTNITSITNNVGNKLTIGNGTTTVEGGKAKVSDNSNATDIATVGDIVNTINNVSWAVAGNGAVQENITAGEVVNFANGNNSVAVVTANKTTGGVDVKFNVEGDLKNISSLTNNGTTITIGDTNNNKVVNVNGANITNVANGTNATDAVNLQQLNASKSVVKAGNYTTVTSTSDANGTVYTVNAEKSVVTEGTNVKVNVTTSGDGLTTYNVSVAGDLTNITSITNNVGNKLTIGNGTTTVEGGKAKVSDNSNATDIATVGDIVKTINNVSWTVSGNGEVKENITAGEVVNFVNGNNSVAVVTANNTTGGVDVKFNVEGALSNITSLTNNGTTITIGDTNNNKVVNVNGANITNVANGTNATDAVNLQQLNASKSVVKAGNYTTVTSTSDANGTVYTVNAEKSVVKAGNNVNVTTETDGKGLTNYTVKVEGDLTNISSITNNGTTIKLDNQNGNKTVDVGGATITNVAAGVNLTDAVNVGQLEKVNATANAGWNVTTNNGNQTYNVKPNATVDLSSSDGNIVIGQKDGNITFALAGNLSNITNISNGDNNSIRLGDNNNITTIISNGTTFTFGAGNTTVNVSGKAELVTGTNSTDVATVGDIIETINGVSWTIAGNGANVSQIKAGDIVNFVDGKNTKASAKVNNGATEVTYNVEGDLTNITSITNNGTTIKLENKDGDKAINVDGATITNVKAGENGTDAVNLDQLNASKSVVKAGNYTTVTSTSDANGTVYTVNAEKSVVVAGTNANVTTTTDGKGLTTYNVSVTGDLTNITSITNNEGNKLTIGNGTTTVDAGKAKVSNNSNATDIATVGDIVNTINNVSWAVAGNGAVKENITAGEVVNFVNGNNTVAVVTANTSTGGADVKFNVEGALSNITSLTNNNGTQITLGDTNNNNVVNVNGANITNVANGTNATDAVNLQQLNASKSVVKAGNYTTVTSISDANGTVYTVNAEKSVVKAGNNVNVTTETDGKGLTNYTVKVEGDLTNISSITNNGTTIKVGVENGNNTVNIGGATITEVKAGVNGTDAVNVDQLEKVNSTANAGWNVSTNKGGKTYNVKPNATVDLRNADGNIVISQDNGNITFDLAGKLTNITNISNGDNHSIRLGDNNNVTTIVNNGTTFTFGEGNTTTNATTGKAEVASGSNNTDVATVGDIVETINNVSWTVAGNGSNVSKIKAGDVVNFVNGNNTVAVVKLNETTNATEVTYHVEGDLTNITSITNGNTSIKLGDANGNNTVNINNATISNVAPGVNGTDAVNVDQLEKVNSTANAGWNLTVNTGENGTNISPNATVDLRNSDGNIVITKDANNVTFDLNNTLTIGGKGKDGVDGKDGQLGVAGKDGADGVTIYGNGTIGINGRDGVDGKPGANASVTVIEGTPGINGKDGETLTRVVYTDANGTTHEIATLDDGLKFKGDTGEVIAKKLGETLEIIGRTDVNANVTDKNLRVDNENGQLVIKMASDLRDINNITSSNGNTTITLSDSNGNNTVNINNATISNVAPGVNGTDAVNVDQLEKVNSTANAGWNLTVNTGENGTNISPNATVDLRNSDGNIVITKDANNVTFDLNNTLTVGGKDGKDGQMGVAGKDGADGVTIYGNGTIGINGRDGVDGKPGANASVTVVEGTPGINGKDGETLTRVVYTDANGTTHEIATLDDGLKFKGDKGEVIAKKLGETLEIIGRTDVNANVTDKNLRVDNENGQLVIKMASDLRDINNITSSNGNTTITLSDSNGNNTVNINNATISNVAPGVNGTDAVNVDQLEKVNSTANAGWNLTVNTGENGTNISPNATVDLRNSDGNIVITKDANNVTFDLNNTLTVGGKGKDGADGKDGQLGVAGKDGADGVTIYGNGTIGINGRDGVDGKPGANASVTVVEGTPGINGKDGETLTRVVYTDANGTTHEIATLDDGLKFKGDKGEVIAKKLGETLEIIGRTDVNANVTDKNLRVDNEEGKLVLKMAKELQEINSISNNNGTTITLGDANNNNTVNINNATISNVAPGVNGTDAVNVDQLEKVNATANAGWTITTNEGNATYNVKPNATVDLRNADGNIVISQDNGNITFDLNSTLTIGGKGKDGVDGKDGQLGVAGKDGADGVTIYGNGTIGINGRDGVDGKPGANASVTVVEGTPGINGKDGETLTRVVYTDANGTTHEIATLDDGLKFKGDKGEVIAKKLGETLEIIGRTDVNANVTDKNLRVDNEEGKLVLKMAKELQEINSISNNNGTTITLGDANNSNTVNINNATISNVAPGVNGTDAVNVDQLEKVNATANAGWFMTTNHGDKSFNVKPNASVDLRTANNNLVITQEDGNITFGLSNNLNLTSNGSVTIGNTTIDNSGLTIKDGPSITENGVDAGDKKVTNVSNGTISAESKDAINGSQLYAVKQIAEAGWNLSVNEGEDAGNVAPGANVDLRNSDGNIVISKDANNVTFNLAKDIKVDTLKANTSVTVGNDTVHTSIMNNGITVKGENSTVTLTDKGLDNGGNKITNVAAGTNATDAVNVSQLNSTIAGVQWKLTGNNDNANATTVGSQTVSFNDSESVKANVDGVNVSFSVKAGELGNEAGKVTSNSTNGTVATVKNVADAINNSGWNIALTDGSNELVKPGDIVKFVNGSGTTANVAKNANGGVEVSFNVNNAEAPKVNEDGSINVPSSENGGSHYVNATTLATTVNNAAWNVDSKAAGGTVINVVNEKRVDSQAATKVKAGNTVNINAGNNIEITRSGADITVATSMTPTFNTVQVGGKEGVTLGSSTAKDGVKELSVGARGAEARITNVAPGIADTDAVNVGQLRGAVGNIHNHINKVDKRVRGVGANAAAGMALPQVYIPGKSMVAASAGTYGGESAVAVGYSRASDNGKLILKMTGTANSQGHLSGGVGVGYQW